MKNKKLIAMICALTVTTSLFTGCGKSGEVKKSPETKKTETNKTETKDNTDDLSEHVNITIGGINVAANSDSMEEWPNDVVKKLEEKFNVSLKLKPYDNESLNLDLSGGTTCDIVQVNDDHIEGVLKGKHAVNLEDYSSITQNINSEKMNYRNEVIKKFKSNGEEKLYFVTPRVTSEDSEANYGTMLDYGYVVRWDLYKEIGCPDINNDDDYVAALKKMKEIYPETEDGLPVYGMGVYNDLQLHSYFFKGCLSQGYANLEGGMYVQDVVKNELLPDIYDVNKPDTVTPFWAGVSFYNKLYKEGLIDPDCFITKGEDLKEKYTKGQYLGGLQNWYYGTYNEQQRIADANTLKEYVTLPTYMGWSNQKNMVGWIGKYFFVSSHSPNVERAVMVLDYIQSEEFSRMLDSGTEDRWEKGSNGTVVLKEDTINMKTDTTRIEEWKKSGIGEGNLGTMVGGDSYNLTEDGSKVSLWMADDVLSRSLTFAQKDICKTFDITLPSELLKKKVEAGTNIDMAAYRSELQMGLEIAPKNIVRIDNNCEQITLNAIPNLVQAKSDEEFNEAKANLMKQLKEAGAEESAAWWANAWENSLKSLDSLK